MKSQQTVPVLAAPANLVVPTPVPPSRADYVQWAEARLTDRIKTKDGLVVEVCQGDDVCFVLQPDGTATRWKLAGRVSRRSGFPYFDKMGQDDEREVKPRKARSAKHAPQVLAEIADLF